MDTCTLYTPLSSSGAIDPRGTRFGICARWVERALHKPYAQERGIVNTVNLLPGRSTAIKAYTNTSIIFSRFHRALRLRCALTYSRHCTQSESRLSVQRTAQDPAGAVLR